MIKKVIENFKKSLFFDLFRGFCVYLLKIKSQSEVKNSTNGTTETEKISRFLFLDSFRGLCAIIVMVGHSYNYFNDTPFYIHKYLIQVQLYGQTLAVNGFFILSTFLLTYRLSTELIDLRFKSIRNVIIVLLKYFVRRFFRIYLVYVAFSTLVKFGPKILGGFVNYKSGLFYPSWQDMVLLKSSGSSHLWTVPPEIKYYFVIPVICLPFLFHFKYTALFVLLTLLSTNYKWIMNKLVDRCDGFWDATCNIWICVPIFLEGSILGILILYLNRYFKQIFNLQKLFSYLVDLLCYILIAIGIIYNEYLTSWPIKSKSNLPGPSLVWLSVLFCMIISKTNTFKIYFFEKNAFLAWVGKISFGVYLFHPMSIQIVVFFKEKHPNISNMLDLSILHALICFFISWLFYVLVENNMIKLAKQICKLLDYFIIKTCPDLQSV